MRSDAWQETEAVASAVEEFKSLGVDLSCVIQARGGAKAKHAPLYTSR